MIASFDSGAPALNLLRPPSLVTLALLATSTVGCAPAIYAAHSGSASRELERARAADAANLAPYEYFYAEAMLHKAREDAGESAYQDAIEYARLAHESAEQARDRARAAMREQGR